VAHALGQEASDQEVLAAVIGHYGQNLRRDDKAGEALRALGVDEPTARSFRVRYSDRSLGPALPGRQWK
jgi:hypothetical protein